MYGLERNTAIDDATNQWRRRLRARSRVAVGHYIHCDILVKTSLTVTK